MAFDVEQTVTSELQHFKFAIQLDESTFGSSNILMASLRFYGPTLNNTVDEFLFANYLETGSKAYEGANEQKSLPTPDLHGAYDSVWHEEIIYKLIASGLEKTYVKWVKNYLTGRIASVRLGAVQSKEVPITWGLPQGAVLSPLLFNIMLSDLPFADGVKLIIYADDITILSKGDFLTEVRACLQRYLDTLATWFKKMETDNESSKLFTTNLHQETQHT
ncbi:Reverse transcriptase domain [Trinorchestia longiramus]|nr:Reverse transcriptase domain [Trinorchestia longiramus]